MSKDEVELGDRDEDYEVVPVGPIRKLERRIDEMEENQSSGGSARDDELVRDVMEIMKSNQKIVNDMTQSTHELKNSVEDLTHKMDDVIDNMNSFMDLLDQASEADLEGEVMNDVHARVADAVGNEMQDVASEIKESNQKVVENIESLNQNMSDNIQDLNKSIKRSYTSQKKDEVLSGDNSVMGGRNQQSQNQDNSQSRRQRSGGPELNIDRGNQSGDQENRSRGQQRNRQGNQQRDQQTRSSRGNSSQDNSDRMRKLKERFDKVQDEE